MPGPPGHEVFEGYGQPPPPFLVVEMGWAVRRVKTMGVVHLTRQQMSHPSQVEPQMVHGGEQVQFELQKMLAWLMEDLLTQKEERVEEEAEKKRGVLGDGLGRHGLFRDE